MPGSPAESTVTKTTKKNKKGNLKVSVLLKFMINNLVEMFSKTESNLLITSQS